MYVKSLQWFFINTLIIIRMYTISALLDITVPFFLFAPPPPPPHENTFRHPCMWIVNLEARVNDFPHCSHKNVFSHVWICMCLVKHEDGLNDFPQWSHE